MRGVSSTFRVMIMIHLTTSIRPTMTTTTASAFVFQSPPATGQKRAVHYSFEQEHHQPRRRPARDARSVKCNLSPLSSSFSSLLSTSTFSFRCSAPERQRLVRRRRRRRWQQQQQQKQYPAMSVAVTAMCGAVSFGDSSRTYRHAGFVVAPRAPVGGGMGVRGNERERWRRAHLMLPMAGRVSAAGGTGSTGDSRATAKVEYGLWLFNTEGRTKQLFRPQHKRRVKFYSCGPTVYDMAHIGNFRAFLTYDVLKRWLVCQGFEVDHVCNITDVDDKIITRMARDGVSLKELTGKYAEYFFDDLKALNIVPASRYPRATEHIDDIVEMVQGLMDKGLAYKVNGSAYFRVSKHSKYGTLASLDKSGMEDGAGEGGGITDSGDFESEKEGVKDFALWKAYKPEDGEVFWDTTIGKGRPGWHIECSAMARKFLGDTLDLHAGGIDLVFPHHENEVAQSEGFTGKPFCGCWVHNAFVNVNGEKMSKSKGNFLTLRGTLTTALDVRAFRYLVVSSQYRTMLSFSAKSLEAAKNTVRRLDKLQAALLEAAAAPSGSADVADLSPDTELVDVVTESLEGFDAAMNDDLNTPRAAASLFAVVKAGEAALKRARSSAAGGDGDAAGAADGALQLQMRRGDAMYLLSALNHMDSVFGVFYDPAGYEAEKSAGGGGETAEELPEVMTELLARRLKAREDKDWATADAVRDEIKALGYTVKDVKGNDPVVSRI